MKSENLNFLEPSGPLQASNGTALPLPLHIEERKSFQVRNQCKLKPQTLSLYKTQF